VALAEARTRTFSWRRKVFMASTPTIKGMSVIEREFEASDQRRFFVPCPHCEHSQWLRFERLRWETGRPETAAYHCEACETPIAEDHKTRMLEQGEWRPTATSADPLTVGFHLSSLYSPVGWLSWERIAREWEAAQASDEAKRSFVNTILGEIWVEAGEAPDWQRLYDRREDFRRGTVPMGGVLLTAGADVQKDRIEVSIWAWGRGLESWLVDHLVIDGGPGEAAAWRELTALLGESWPHAAGTHVGLVRLAIDTGYKAPAAYAWARRQGFAQVLPLKGAECGGLQPRGAGVGTDARRCHRGRRQDPPRRPAVDGGGGHVQERDLPVPAVGSCVASRSSRRRSSSCSSWISTTPMPSSTGRRWRRCTRCSSPPRRRPSRSTRFTFTTQPASRNRAVIRL
jgi:phage terminase large subunit GpA-like protein